MSEPIEQVNGADQTPSDVWDQEMATLATLPADEALIYIITVMAPSADELEGYHAKTEAANMQQISTDQNLANDMYAQYNQYGNIVIQQENGEIDSTTAQSEENQCVINAQKDAAQINYDMENATVYKSNPSFTSSVDSQMNSIFGGTQYLDNPEDPTTASNLWNSDWTNAYPPTDYSGDNPGSGTEGSTGNTDRDPSGVQARTTAFQNVQDSFSGMSNVQQQIMKAQKSNLSMTNSINHSFASSYISQEQTPANATKPT